ncbi:hypothetical protein [Glaciecola sp. KUL10]|uniref:hypothetical protein n=1 Tax=Glaciecola sp. (strain KUL10) TaxID=2161813 RepID=UPI000D788286|nr:hypothetical protein [Glaciecola sp. KUL10]GBL04849.1 heavy metal efflux pump, CzcA family [Glaciecola sp. KUL10]
MKKLFIKIALTVITIIGSNANAAFITNSDIASVSVDAAPSNYTIANIDALFDGIFGTSSPDVAFTANAQGGTRVSSALPISLTFALNGKFDIFGAGIANDFGSLFLQQVSALEIIFNTDTGQIAVSNSMLVQNTFSVIDLGSIAAFGVDSFTVNIFGSQGNKVELREIVLEATKQVTSSSSISEPIYTSALFLALLAAARTRRSKR